MEILNGIFDINDSSDLLKGRVVGEGWPSPVVILEWEDDTFRIGRKFPTQVLNIGTLDKYFKRLVEKCGVKNIIIENCQLNINALSGIKRKLYIKSDQDICFEGSISNATFDVNARFVACQSKTIRNCKINCTLLEYGGFQTNPWYSLDKIRTPFKNCEVVTTIVSLDFSNKALKEFRKHDLKNESFRELFQLNDVKFDKAEVRFDPNPSSGDGCLFVKASKNYLGKGSFKTKDGLYCRFYESA